MKKKYLENENQNQNFQIQKEIEIFFQEMEKGQKTSNQKIVEFLENEKGLKISAEIKTDIVLEIVKKISKTQNVKREKANPDNKWAKWIYVKG